jgi:hypothetical protein
MSSPNRSAKISRGQPSFPHRNRHTVSAIRNAPAMRRQIGKRPLVAAVDSPRELAAAWAGRTHIPGSGDRRHAAVLYPHLLDD